MKQFLYTLPIYSARELATLKAGVYGEIVKAQTNITLDGLKEAKALQDRLQEIAAVDPGRIFIALWKPKAIGDWAAEPKAFSTYEEAEKFVDTKRGRNLPGWVQEIELPTTPIVGPLALAALQEAVGAWPDSFDGGEEELNGGDLVEWFSGWREKAKAALAASGAEPVSTRPTVAVGPISSQFRTAGYEIVQTGGGGTAWEKRWPDGLYAWITDNDGGSHMIGDPHDFWLCGIYRNDGTDIEMLADCATMDGALDWVESKIEELHQAAPDAPNFA